MSDNEKFLREKKKLMEAKTPADFVDRMVKSKLSIPEKGWASKEWQAEKGYTIEDIKKARRKNPVIREKLRKQISESNRKRLEKYNYRTGDAKQKWDKDKIAKFYDLAKSGMPGNKLAKQFKTSIPTVYFIQRKIKMNEQIMELKGEKPNKAKVIAGAVGDEKKIREKLRELQKGKRR